MLTERTLNRSEFLRKLNPFYVAIEKTARTITDFSQKQGFLNAVYEQFFQGFSIKVADTHGIVYTPQPIVDFMVKSVEHIGQTMFGRSLSDSGVHIIDPFVGTGNFIVRIMQELDPIALGTEIHRRPARTPVQRGDALAILHRQSQHRTSVFHDDATDTLHLKVSASWILLR